MNGKNKSKHVATAPAVGLVQWFHIHQYEEVEKTLADLDRLKINHIRTNISWADWHTEGGQEWYDWLFSRIGKDIDILPCILYTPPSLGIKPKSSAPPKNTRDYADFVDTIIQRYGKRFEYIELWNEPNNMLEYDFTLDPDWSLFASMITDAAYWCRQCGKKTVLGGMSPIDANWLRHMFQKGVMEHIDVVGIHGFPDVFDFNWEGWENEIQKVTRVLKEYQSEAVLWITEAGFSTWQKDERRQAREFLKAMEAGADRMYWYGLKDLAPELPAVDRFHLDEREYAFGIKHADDSPKLLYTLLAANGLNAVRQLAWLTDPMPEPEPDEKYILVTGGAGFVGTNLAARLLSEGKNVLVLDNLSRAGVYNNLIWLRKTYPDHLRIMIADIRDRNAVQFAVKKAEMIFHFAAQVAVTTSLTNPFHDFEVNAQGTLNLLEAIRHAPVPPPVVYTSTNKVYGDLHDVGMEELENRYRPEAAAIHAHGIGEDRNLDFHSPYGCTKGVADQYMLDYARTYGLKTMVFRMSCIYGPHQFGTEDQGWVAHFLISALKEQPIVLYGTGKQVRDILYVEDLVDAFVLALDNIDRLSGKAFNIGGGPDQSISLRELVIYIGELTGRDPEVQMQGWRPSDQKFYVSDTSFFREETGWFPKNKVKEGVPKLLRWLKRNNPGMAAAARTGVTETTPGRTEKITQP